MGRESRRKRERREARGMESTAAMASTWLDREGVHVVAPGTAPSPEGLEEMTRQYQQAIRQSPMWDEMVRQFGKKKAEELLQECKAELK